ncbi:hypothetical protein [Streptomyces rimosus]
MFRLLLVHSPGIFALHLAGCVIVVGRFHALYTGMLMSLLAR